ncbi:unnamed protein product [Caenorhabditis brenneri]
MRNYLLTLLFLVCSVSCAPGTGDCTKEDLKECIPFGKKLDLYMRNFEGYRLPPAVYENATIVCDSLKQCYGNLKCKNAAELQEDFNIKCSKLEYLTATIHVCLPRFFKAVYEKKYECAKKYDFLTRDLTKKAKIYKDGKPCFIEIAKEVCSPESVDYLNNEEKYNRLVNILSVKPDNNCRGPHHEFSVEQCKPVVRSLDDFKIDYDKVEINDPKLLGAIERCKEVTECVKDSCYYPMAIKVLDACTLYQIVNTQYGRCLPKMRSQKPEVSKYSCLNGKWPMERKQFCGNPKAGECVKSVMEAECGEQAVENFEELFKKSQLIHCRPGPLTIT